MRRVLVTGGAGFIGSHLCRALLARGDAVVCVDDLSTGRPQNIADLRGCDGFTFVRHDVTRPYGFEVDAVFNLACPASPRDYQRDPVRTLDTCYLGTRNALELARSRGIRLLQTSTSEVYGDPDVHPQPEHYRGNVDPTGPRACYDEGKRVAESLCRAYADRDGVQVRIARIFNTYGPDMRVDDGRVVPAFLAQLIARRPLTLFGDGQQTRSFCYVSDLVRGLLALLECNTANAEPVNLGNPEEMTIAELAQVVSRLGGRPLAIEHRALPAQDPRRRRPDITRARALLGWAPEVELRDGLARTLAAMSARADLACQAGA
ncbi:MAG: SDR family oxidoreductase [Myxococcales bacterium]|nr:SDR family oxidoreductase [Myxococcales bacterium]